MEQQSVESSSNSAENENEEKAPDKEKLISITKDSIGGDNSTIEFPKDGTQFTIEPTNKDVQLIINPFTGIVHQNVHYVEGDFYVRK